MCLTFPQTQGRGNKIHFNVWDEIIYPFPNFNGATVEISERISNFIPHFTYILEVKLICLLLFSLWYKMAGIHTSGPHSWMKSYTNLRSLKWIYIVFCLLFFFVRVCGWRASGKPWCRARCLSFPAQTCITQPRAAAKKLAWVHIKRMKHLQ